jgi:pimeloyl-ACP methyl ester carboxylesterase
MLQRTLPSATLSLLPATGHTLNLEDPDVFNALVQDFLTAVAPPASA